jgi:hypothetical protein
MPGAGAHQLTIDGFLRREGTGTLEFLGYPLCIDTMQAGPIEVNVYPVSAMPYSTSGVVAVRLLPAPSFQLQTSPGGPTAAVFRLAANGTSALATAWPRTCG